MKNPTESDDSPLLPMLARLKACPSRDIRISEKTLLEAWNNFKQIEMDHASELTPAVMAGLILHDKEQFSELLNEAERSQLAALAKAALERCKQLTNPPNKLGKAIAASLKEST